MFILATSQFLGCNLFIKPIYRKEFLGFANGCVVPTDGWRTPYNMFCIDPKQLSVKKVQT
jgi:hypothetical protein